MIFLLGILAALRQMVLPQLLATDMVAASHSGDGLSKNFPLVFAWNIFGRGAPTDFYLGSID